MPGLTIRRPEGRVGSNPSGVSAWDVVVLSFRLLYQRIHVWIQANMLFLLISLPVLTLPGGKAALAHAAAEGLRDPSGVFVDIRKSMQNGFRRHAIRAFLVSVIKSTVFVVILLSIYFWVTREEVWSRYISILSFYALFLWWCSSGYLFPVLVAHPDRMISEVLKEAVRLALQHPFESLLFSVVGGLLQALGIVLLGPILLVVPVAQSILWTHGYWCVTGELIPGLFSEQEYAAMVFSE